MEKYEPQKDYSTRELDRKTLKLTEENRQREIKYLINVGIEVKEAKKLVDEPAVHTL